VSLLLSGAVFRLSRWIERKLAKTWRLVMGILTTPGGAERTKMPADMTREVSMFREGADVPQDVHWHWSEDGSEEHIDAKTTFHVVQMMSTEG
jgi:hypothetical protein